MVVEAAITGLAMATLLDPADPQVRAAAEVARLTFERVGAKPLPERLALAMGSAQPV